MVAAPLALDLLTFDELPTRLEPDVVSVQLGAFRGAIGHAGIEALRRSGASLPDYVGVFAVSAGRVLGQALVERRPYRFPEGPGTVGGIAMVTTRADVGRRGIARKLLADVHRREREAGTSHVMLWTNRSWGAHRLYRSLGYEDIYVPAQVARAFPRAPSPSASLRVRTGRRSDAGTIESLFRNASRDRTGFVPRTEGQLRRSFTFEGVNPTSFHLAHREGRAVGYAQSSDGFRQVACGELIAEDSATREVLVRALARRARGGILTLGNSLVESERRYLRRRGFGAPVPGWFVLMAKSLEATRPRRVLVRECGTDRAEFQCLSGDRF